MTSAASNQPAETGRGVASLVRLLAGVAAFKLALYRRFCGLATNAQGIGLLGLRLALASVFWSSALTKVQTATLFTVGDFRFRVPLPVIQDGTFILFSYEYFPTAPAWLTDTAAVLATVFEVILPPLLALGLFTRFAAAGLLVMTLVIQAFVYPTWSHFVSPAMWWAAAALALVAFGGGVLSLDRRLGVDHA